jgi:hypothetical protein
MDREAATGGRMSRDEFVGYSTPRNLKAGAYTGVSPTLSLDPIDPQTRLAVASSLPRARRRFNRRQT